MSAETAPTVRMERDFKHPPERLFEAWTRPDHLAKWFCAFEMTHAEADLDLRAGGAYRIVMKGPEGSYEHKGTFVEIDPPSRLVFTWHSDGTGGAETLVTVHFLNGDQGGTRLVLEHERLPTQSARDNRTRGWTSVLDKLDGFLV